MAIKQGADQMCSYCTSDLHLCLHIDKKSGFVMKLLLFYPNNYIVLLDLFMVFA